MHTESHIKRKLVAIAIGLLAVSTLIVVIWTKSSNEILTDSQIMRETLDDISLRDLNKEQDSIREIRDLLVQMEMNFSSQLSAIEALSQQNRNEILELWRYRDEYDNEEIGAMALDGSEEDSAFIADLEQEQANLDAAARQAEYERQLEYFLASQQEDVSWSVQVEADLHAAFGNHMDMIQLNSVTCGDVMCRVTANVIGIDNLSAEQYPQLDHIIHGDVAWPGQSMFKMDLESGDITLYLMRAGADFPQQRS